MPCDGPVSFQSREFGVGHISWYFFTAVGHHEDAFTEVRGTTRCRRNNLPLRVIPHLGQVANDKVESSLDESGDVLHEDVAGSKVANNSGELGPEPARVFLRETLTGETDGLAGESSGDEVDSLCASVDVPDVLVAFDSGPVMGEDRAAVGVDLALPSDREACSLQAKIKSPNAREEGADIHAANLAQGFRRSRLEKSKVL